MYEDEFIVLILKQFLQKLIVNSILKEENMQNFLKNFTNLVQNFDEIVGVNLQLKILTLQCINKMASKNAG